MTSQIKKYYAEQELIAIVVPKDTQVADTTFYTNPDDLQQVGYVVQTKESRVSKHFHEVPEAAELQYQETIYVVAGTLEVTFYSQKDYKLETILLKEGDLLIQYQVGHSFKFFTDTKLLEVKQGPYIQKAH